MKNDFEQIERSEQDAPQNRTHISASERKFAHRGIGRAAYFGLSFLVLIIATIPEIAAGAGDGALGLFLILVAASLFIGGARYRNIGYDPRFIILALIPLVNLIVAYQCLAFPPGYAHTKVWDVPMKIVTGIYIAVGFSIMLAILSAM